MLHFENNPLARGKPFHRCRDPRLNFFSDESAFGIERGTMFALAFEEIGDAFVVASAADLRCLVFGTRLAAAQLIEANISYDAVEPGVEAALEAKAMQIAVHLEEGFLINVAGIFRPLHQIKSKPQNVAVVATHQLLERSAATRLRLCHKSPFVKLGQRSHRSQGGFWSAHPARFIGKRQSPSWKRHLSPFLRVKPCCRISSNTLAEKHT